MEEQGLEVEGAGGTCAPGKCHSLPPAPGSLFSALDGGSGRRHNQAATTAIHTIGIAAIHQRCEATDSMMASSTTADNNIVNVAAHLPRRDTAPCACHSRIIGPKRLCVSRYRCRRSEPRDAAKAAIRMNTTVGMTGKKIPTMPAAKLQYASTNQAQRYRDGALSGVSGEAGEPGLFFTRTFYRIRECGVSRDAWDRPSFFL
jgi:hypothetical protein